MINNKSIMDQPAAYLATNSEYVICKIDYRLLSDNDKPVTLNQTVEAAFDAVLWVKDNINRYNGDSAWIAVTNPFWPMSGSMASGIFGAEFNATSNQELYRALSPIYNIPNSSQRKLPPQLLRAGSKGAVVTPT